MYLRDTSDKVKKLEGELSFLEKGGYPSPVVWRGLLVFESSPTCCKKRASACEDCVLLDFVPPEHHSEATPCRYISLTERGQSLNDLYKTATPGETELHVCIWLHKTIRRLKENPEWRKKTSGNTGEVNARKHGGPPVPQSVSACGGR